MSIQFFPENIRKFVEEATGRLLGLQAMPESRDTCESPALTDHSGSVHQVSPSSNRDTGKGVESTSYLSFSG